MMSMILALVAQGLLPLAATILAGAGTWAATRLSNWLKLSSESTLRRDVQSLAEVVANAIHGQLAAAVPAVGAPATPQAELLAGMVQDGAGYIATRMPEAVAKLGISPQGLVDMLRTRLQARGLMSNG